MAIQITGNEINLKAKLGNEYYQVSNFLKKELGITLENIEKEIKFYEPDFFGSMTMFSRGVKGFYLYDSKSIWIRDIQDNPDILVHEITHAIQFKRKGFFARIQKRLNNMANFMLQEKNIGILYLLDSFEREARKVQRRYQCL